MNPVGDLFHVLYCIFYSLCVFYYSIIYVHTHIYIIISADLVNASITFSREAFFFLWFNKDEGFFYWLYYRFT